MTKIFLIRKTVIDIIKINLWSIPVFSFFALTGQLKLCILAYSTAILHELGHILVAKYFKYKILSIEILPVGICANIDASLKKNPIHELIVASSGPCVNLIITILCIVLYILFKINTDIFVSVNMYMLIMNLLPVVPLDGGRILNACLMLELKNKKADKISAQISACMIIAVFILGCLFFYKTGANFSLLTIALFLAGTIKFPDKSMQLVKITDNTFTEPCRVKGYAVPEDITVLEAIKEINRKEVCVLYILDKSGNVTHITTNKKLLIMMSDGIYNRKIEDVFERRKYLDNEQY